MSNVCVRVHLADPCVWLTPAHARSSAFRFRNIRNTDGWALGWPSVHAQPLTLQPNFTIKCCRLQVQAVYLDDQLSGTIITDNLFENCMTGVVLGGGRDNVVMFNHFVDTDLAVHLDNRGMNWQQQVTRSTLLFHMYIRVTGIGDAGLQQHRRRSGAAAAVRQLHPATVRTTPPTPNINTAFAY
jgi:hypothetical protein